MGCAAITGWVSLMSQSDTAYAQGIAPADIPLPRCPACGATGQRCKRPSGHDASQWHLEREDAMARLCGCPPCQAWLRTRGAQARSEQLVLGGGR